MDSLDICYKPLPQKSPRALREGQRLPFGQSTDAVLNDERGLILGPKFVLGSSCVQGDDQNRVSRLFFEDARIKLSHGLHVGMPQVLKLLIGKGALPISPIPCCSTVVSWTTAFILSLGMAGWLAFRW